MGVHKNIGIDKFPKQGSYLGKKVEVCFNYNTNETVQGRIVRDDAEDPGCMIIKLQTGRYVNANECQYSLIEKEDTANHIGNELHNLATWLQNQSHIDPPEIEELAEKMRDIAVRLWKVKS